MKTNQTVGKPPLTRSLDDIQKEWDEVIASLHAAAKRSGADRMTMAEIDAEIKAARRERATRYAHA